MASSSATWVCGTGSSHSAGIDRLPHMRYGLRISAIE
jgi:hypothetical protein